MNHHSIVRAVAALAVAFLLATGCTGSTDPVQSPAEKVELNEVTIPADFQWNPRVTGEIELNLEALEPGSRVEVFRQQDGKLFYATPVLGTEARTFRAKLPVRQIDQCFTIKVFPATGEPLEDETCRGDDGVIRYQAS